MTQTLQELGAKLIEDMSGILLTAEHKRTKREVGAVNRLNWTSLSIETATAIKYIASKSGVTLSGKQARLVSDCLASAYRMSRSCAPRSVGVPPQRPEVIQSYKETSVECNWKHLAVQAAIAIIDQAADQATTSPIAEQEAKLA